MDCSPRVSVIKNLTGKVIDMNLVCEGTCTLGGCKKIRTPNEPLSEDESGKLPKPRLGRYETWTEKCLCKKELLDGTVDTYVERSIPPECCRVVLRYIADVAPPPHDEMINDQWAPGVGPFPIIVKVEIKCEHVDDETCESCDCRPTLVEGSKKELVDEDGYVTATSETVVCNCL